MFHKPRDVRYEDVPDPRIEAATDVVLRVTSTAICGSDLHIYNGLFPQPRPLVLGHEFMGIVEEVGADVRRLRVGDRVIVPFSIACGGCWFCQRHMPTHCELSNPRHYGPDGGLLAQKGGGLFGYTELYGGYAGGQAERVRVPFADNGARVVPAHLRDEEVLFLTDIMPTGWCGAEWGNVRSGDVVAVFGAGPVGLMAAKACRIKGATRVVCVDIQPYRLDKARSFADADTIDAREEDAVETLRAMTGGRGPDVVIDAVGMEADQSLAGRVGNLVRAQAGTISAFEACLRAVRRGGRVAVVGVYGTDYDRFPLGRFFDKGLTMRAGQATVHNHVDELLDHVAKGRLSLEGVISHEMPLSAISEAYRIFNDKLEGCVKVVLKP